MSSLHEERITAWALTAFVLNDPLFGPPHLHVGLRLNFVMGLLAKIWQADEICFIVLEPGIFDASSSSSSSLSSSVSRLHTKLF
jgi:hypothetical protein